MGIDMGMGMGVLKGWMVEMSAMGRDGPDGMVAQD